MRIILSVCGRHSHSASSEQLIFDNIAAVRDDKPGSINLSDSKAAHLVAGDPSRRIGTAIMLRVMPGDKFTFGADSYYESDETETTETPAAEDVVNSLVTALTGGTVGGMPVGEAEGHVDIVNQALGNPEVMDFIHNQMDQQQNTNGPKAGLNYLFFNQDFQLLPALSGKLSITAVPGIFSNIGTSSGIMSEPGYVVVFVDNNSIGTDVWFDNVLVSHYSGQILEENHYYPYGLTLSEQAAGAGEQPYKYNGKELEKSFGLEWYDYGARTYDMTTPIWGQIDPHAESYYSISPYAYCANNPVKYMDVDGRDYVLAVNHDTRSITVKATYYTATGNTNAYNSAVNATNFWNNQSGNYQYAVGKGDNAVNYSVNFDLTVRQVDNPRNELYNDRNKFKDEQLTPDKSSNTYSVLQDSDPKLINNNEGQSTNGTTTDGAIINIKESRSDAPDTGPHEVGHTLGLGHYGKGVMTAASTDPARSATTNRSNVQDIIKNATNRSGTDVGRGSVNQTGTAPDNFNKGKVKEVEN